MANVKITDLAALTNPASTDVLPIVDVGADVTKKVSVGEVVGKISGDVNVSTNGTSSIASGAIVNADINASAAIAGTKIDPDFGNQTVETTGVFSAAGGAAATPSIAFTGDLNTGIYSPGADQVAISTNGTGRLFVASDGNVGIGIQSPGSILSTKLTSSVSWSSGGALTSSNNNSFTGLRIENDDNSANVESALLFIADTAQHSITSVKTGSAVGDLVFRCRTGSASSAENLRITSDGKLGLGTSSPETVLHLNTSTNPTAAGSTGPEKGAVLISAVGATAGTNNLGAAIAFSRINTTRRGAMIAAVESGADPDQQGLAFFTRSETITASDAVDERLRIDELGRVGIGTTSPDALLHLLGSGAEGANTEVLNLSVSQTGAAAGPEVKFYSGTNNLQAGIASSRAGSTSGALSFRTNAAGTYSEKFKINSNGECTISANSSTAPFIANIGASEVARIDSSGRLLVGTSSERNNFFSSISPHFLLEGTGISSSTIGVVCNSTSNTAAPIFALGKSASGTVGSNSLVADNEKLGQIDFLGNDGTAFINGARIFAEVDGTPGSNDMPGRLVFSVTADGASSPTEALRITNDRYVRLASGSGGIQFNGDTAAANALDDYEEGTWNPSYLTDGGNPLYTITATDAKYTKIGRLVCLRWYVAISGYTGVNSGNLRIRGIPFLPAATEFMVGRGGYTATDVAPDVRTSWTGFDVVSDANSPRSVFLKNVSTENLVNKRAFFTVMYSV